MDTTSFPTGSDLLRERRTLAIIVLYRKAPGESEALHSLATLLSDDGKLAAEFACFLYDNSPEPQVCPEAPFPILYHHDPSNPGLARAYEAAFTMAKEYGLPWLLLLDQDTTLTAEFLHELTATELTVADDPTIVAIAPKLMQDGDLLSPHWPLFHRLRKPLRHAHSASSAEIRVFNSGSTMRTEALLQIGGFPQSFPLDFLDHAVYRQLQRRGGKVFLMHSALQHELGSKYSRVERDYRQSARIRSILLYESRYFRLYGTPLERVIHSLRRSRVALRLLLRNQGKEALEVLRVTFLDV